MTHFPLHDFRQQLELFPIAAYFCASNGQVQAANRLALEFWEGLRQELSAGRLQLSEGLSSSDPWSGWPILPEPQFSAPEIPELCRMALELGERQSASYLLGTAERQQTAVEFACQVVSDSAEEGLLLATIVPHPAGHASQEEAAIREALGRSEKRLRLAVQATQLGLWDYNLEEGTVYFSPEWLAHLGLTNEDIAGNASDWEERLHPQDHPRVLAELQSYLDGNSPAYDVEFRMRHKDGSYRWIQTRGEAQYDLAGKPIRISGCHIDVTDSKSTEITLRHILQSVTSTTGSEFFSNVVEFLAAKCNADTVIIAEATESNGGIATTLALFEDGQLQDNTSYRLAGTPCETLFSQDDQVCVYNDVQSLFPNDKILVDQGMQSYIGIPLSTSDGSPIGLLSLMKRSEIEYVEHAKSLLQALGARCSAELERMQAEQKIRIREDRLRSITATMPIAVYVFNQQENRLEYANDVAVSALGYSRKDVELVKDRIHESLMHPDDLARVDETKNRWQSAEDGEILEKQSRLKSKSGEYLWFQHRETVYERDAEGNVLTTIGCVVDITGQIRAEQERERLARQSQRTQKLESLGVLAGGIAHDFNNLLSSMMSFAEIAQLSVAPESEAFGAIEQVIQAAANASELTEQMLAYSGKSKPDAQQLDLSELVEKTALLLQVSISKDCRLEFDLEKDLPSITGDAGQIRQVIMNLLINASDAIGPRQGCVRISTETKRLQSDEMFHNFSAVALAPGTYVCLTVEDDGCGMDDNTAHHIFDPFFTTKFSGHGLGLSAVQGIVKSHQGGIQVESRLKQGTKICIALPSAETTKTTESDDTKEKEYDMRNGKILLAEDEECVAQATTRLLNYLGFEVVVANDGSQAVEQFRAAAGEFDLVILDLTMPHLDGIETQMQIREIAPGTRFVLTSGYNEDMANQISFAESVPYLRKPFRLAELKSVLQSALGAECLD